MKYALKLAMQVALKLNSSPRYALPPTFARYQYTVALNEKRQRDKSA